jgi:M6 family metalloprotease-like protein
MVALPNVTVASSGSASAGTVVAYPNYKVAALLVTYPDNPTKPTRDDHAGVWTRDYLDQVLFTNAKSMAAYFAAESAGRVSVTGQVFDNGGQWYQVSRPVERNGRCDWTPYFRDVFAAADADVDFSQFNSVMIFTPTIDCASGGTATSGYVPETNQWYGVTVMNSSLNTYPHHELGHLMRLGHANSWQCDPPGILTGTNCKEYEYGDRYGIMGASSRMLSLPAPQREFLGWFSAGEEVEVASDGDYTIQNYETTSLVPKVLKIPKARDAAGNVTEWYYLEYRQPIGFDYVVNTPTIHELGVPNGILVRMGFADASRNAISTLLDMTPGSTPSGLDIFKPALQLGSSYSDPVAGVSFGMLSRTAKATTIRVRFSAASLCQRNAPTATIKVMKGIAKPGQEFRYDVTVKNPSILCGSLPMEFRPLKVPSGWSVTIDKQKKKTVNIVSGQTQKFVVRVTAPKKAKYQKYYITLEARQAKQPTLKRAVVVKPVVKR